MSLIDEAMTACKKRIPTLTPDGHGGRITAWTDGEAFNAAVIFNDRDPMASIANAVDAKAQYTVTFPVSVSLQFHDVFKRLSDGAVFRVISSDGENKKTPPRASFQFCQVTAERWEEAK